MHSVSEPTPATNHAINGSRGVVVYDNGEAFAANLRCTRFAICLGWLVVNGDTARGLCYGDTPPWVRGYVQVAWPLGLNQANT